MFILVGSKVINKMLSDPVLGKLLKKPSVSCGSQVLYAASGLFEVRMVWIFVNSSLP